MPAFRDRPRLATFLLFAALAVAHTWPLVTAPGRLSRNDNADTTLNEWTLAWIAHQLPRDPIHLFDANIFYPDRNTLAYSELLLPPAVAGAPLAWLGASPVLVYNVMLLAGLALTGWTGCLLVWRWSGDLAAGTIAGAILAFNAHTLTRLPQLQALHIEFIPLALLAFDALLTSPGRRHAIWLGVWVALQGMTSYYGLVFLVTALTAGALVRPSDWTGRSLRRVAPWLLLAVLVAAILLTPFLLPYVRLGEVRPLNEVARYSARWRDYLASPARVHFKRWSAPFFGGPAALFPGVVALALAAWALVTGVAFRDRRARMALAFAGVGVALSFGPALPGYRLLYRLAPPLWGIRNAARFGFLATVAAAILGGLVVARFRTRHRGARWLPALTVCLLVLVNLDAFSAPIGYVDASGPAPIFARLRQSDAIVAEFPFYPPDRVFHNADYMLDSTANWRPMLNGYSGLTPQSYVQHYEELRGFPDARAIAALRATGVTYVFVRFGLFDGWTAPGRSDAVRHSTELRLVAEANGIGLFRLVR
jgi:hypothetical protein